MAWWMSQDGRRVRPRRQMLLAQTVGQAGFAAGTEERVEAEELDLALELAGLRLSGPSLSNGMETLLGPTTMER